MFDQFFLVLVFIRSLFIIMFCLGSVLASYDLRFIYTSFPNTTNYFTNTTTNTTRYLTFPIN